MMPRCEFCGSTIKKGGQNYKWHLNEHPVCQKKYAGKKHGEEKNI